MTYRGKSAIEMKGIFGKIANVFGPSKKNKEILSQAVSASYLSGESDNNWRKYKKIRTNIGDLYSSDYVKAVKKSTNPPTFEKPYVKWDSDNYNITSKTNTTKGRMILETNKDNESKKKNKLIKNKYKHIGKKQKGLYLRKGKFIG